MPSPTSGHRRGRAGAHDRLDASAERQRRGGKDQPTEKRLANHHSIPRRFSLDRHIAARTYSRQASTMWRGQRQRRDQHHVEAQVERGESRVPRQIELGRVSDATALARGDRFQRRLKALSRLDLDESQRAAAPRDDVDLAYTAAMAPRQDAIALEPQPPGAARLGKSAVRHRLALARARGQPLICAPAPARGHRPCARAMPVAAAPPRRPRRAASCRAAPRRSASSIVLLARRLLGGRRTDHHHDLALGRGPAA